jgi:hypothetical protein
VSEFRFSTETGSLGHGPMSIPLGMGGWGDKHFPNTKQSLLLILGDGETLSVTFDYVLLLSVTNFNYQLQTGFLS